jgi:hypothetical protein
VVSKIIGQYTCILTNNAQKLIPADLSLNVTQKEWKIMPMLRFKPGSLARTIDENANSVKPPLLVLQVFIR